MPLPIPDVSDAAHAFLATERAQHILRTHPNTLTVPEVVPSVPYIALLRAYITDEPDEPIPPHLRAFIAQIRRLQLPRTPIALPDASLPLSANGMSPKKAHEVSRMASYILHLVRLNALPEETLHIVDVGAGQGYLTRALKALLPQAHILALDADDQQTRGAQRWEERLLPGANPPIVHRTVMISERSLREVVDEWVQSEGHEEIEGKNKRGPVPVLFVALHACGSLTPDVLRAFIASSKSPNPNAHWTPAGVVAVGCCYNLMNPSDFPLSPALRALPPLNLPPAAFHLAAQIPDTWLPPPSSLPAPDPVVAPAVALAIRKVVWRALLERALKTARPAEQKESTPTPAPLKENKSATVPARWPRRVEMLAASSPSLSSSSPFSSPSNPSSLCSAPPATPTPPPPMHAPLPADHTDPATGIGATPALRRLGRLRDAAYASWGAFLSEAALRMGVVFDAPGVGVGVGERRGGEDVDERESGGEREGEDVDERLELERRLENLHVLRCLLGPVVESLVLRDRAAWVRAELGLVQNGANLGDGATSTMGDHANAEADEDGKEGEKEDGGRKDLKVALVNLFDQRTGSGRNVALVVARSVPFLSSKVEI